jgi:hypothetical protein
MAFIVPSTTSVRCIFASFGDRAPGRAKLNSPGVGDLPPFLTLLEINGKDTAVGCNASFIELHFIELHNERGLRLSECVYTQSARAVPRELCRLGLAIRGGYFYDQNPVPDAAFNLQVADANNHSVSVGLDLLCKDAGRFLGLLECGKLAGKFLNTCGCSEDCAPPQRQLCQLPLPG